MASAEEMYSVVPPPNESNATRGRSSDGGTGQMQQCDAAAPIDEGEIRTSLLVEAKRRKVWGTKAVSKMQFLDLQQSTCYRYTLESFTETRSTSETAEAHTEGFSTIENYIDIGPNCTNVVATQNITFAPAQNPWDYEVLPDREFADSVKVRDLPDSTRVSKCPSCNGSRVTHCFPCKGKGSDNCTSCRRTGMKAGIAHPAVYTHPMIGTFPGGTNQMRGGHMWPAGIVRPPNQDKPYAVGTPVHFMAKAGLPPPGIGQHDLCIHCKGHGMRECTHCKGVGKKPCNTCHGSGTARVTTKLKVVFCVERSNFYTACDISDILLHRATGEMRLTESGAYVVPLQKHPMKEINEASRTLCATHLHKCMGCCRILKQRHRLEAIAVVKVRFRLGTKSGIFYVYGNERLCYIPKNSSKCALM
jgi:hypothetical protein